MLAERFVNHVIAWRRRPGGLSPARLVAAFHNIATQVGGLMYAPRRDGGSYETRESAYVARCRDGTFILAIYFNEDEFLPWFFSARDWLDVEIQLTWRMTARWPECKLLQAAYERGLDERATWRAIRRQLRR